MQPLEPVFGQDSSFSSYDEEAACQAADRSGSFSILEAKLLLPLQLMTLALGCLDHLIMLGMLGDLQDLLRKNVVWRLRLELDSAC